MERRTGGCHCGAVRFAITGPVRDVIYCHCSQCRRQSGHFFAATACGDEQISITGTDSITWYAASQEAERGFCSCCGGSLFWKRHGSETISILAGVFDNPSGLRASHHIHVADKGDYYEIADGLPQYSGSG